MSKGFYASKQKTQETETITKQLEVIETQFKKIKKLEREVSKQKTLVEEGKLINEYHKKHALSFYEDLLKLQKPPSEKQSNYLSNEKIDIEDIEFNED